ncbi:hypothetical protein ACLOJK_037301 [Asimina triloba]
MILEGRAEVNDLTARLVADKPSNADVMGELQEFKENLSREMEILKCIVRGSRNGDETFVASLNEEAILVETGTLSSESEMDVLEDVESSPQCPIKMDPQRRRHIDQAVESTNIVQSPIPKVFVSSKQTKLKKELRDKLDVGIIQHVKAPNGILVRFQRKRDESRWLCGEYDLNVDVSEHIVKLKWVLEELRACMLVCCFAKEEMFLECSVVMGWVFLYCQSVFDRVHAVEAIELEALKLQSHGKLCTDGVRICDAVLLSLWKDLV